MDDKQQKWTVLSGLRKVLLRQLCFCSGYIVTSIYCTFYNKVSWGITYMGVYKRGTKMDPQLVWWSTTQWRHQLPSQCTDVGLTLAQHQHHHWHNIGHCSISFTPCGCRWINVGWTEGHFCRRWTNTRSPTVTIPTFANVEPMWVGSQGSDVRF